MDNYLDLLNDVIDNGVLKGDRTNTGTRSVFGRTMRFDISGGKIPLLTTKKVFIRSVLHELLWFISGNTDLKYLKDNNVGIWDSWVKPGTEVYRPLTLVERVELLLKKDSSTLTDELIECIQKTSPFLMPSRGLKSSNLIEFLSRPFGEGLSDSNVKIIHSKLSDMYIPTQVLADGELGPVYGKQWRKWQDTRIVGADGLSNEEMEKRGYVLYTALPNDERLYIREIDQLANAIELLKTDPDSRRIIVNAWNPADMEDMALSPCHALFQFYSYPMCHMERAQWGLLSLDANGQQQLMDYINDAIADGIDQSSDSYIDTFHDLQDNLGIPRRKLSCLLYQRSVDSPIGLPLNIACYAILTQMVAQVVGMTAGEFIWVGGDTHIYLNQLDAVDGQLMRTPSESPTLKINKDIKDIDAFTFDDFELVGYDPQPFIRIPVAV